MNLLASIKKNPTPLWYMTKPTLYLKHKFAHESQKDTHSDAKRDTVSDLSKQQKQNVHKPAEALWLASGCNGHEQPLC